MLKSIELVPRGKRGETASGEERVSSIGLGHAPGATDAWLMC